MPTREIQPRSAGLKGRTAPTWGCLRHDRPRGLPSGQNKGDLPCIIVDRPRLEALEGKVLLSAGLADPAATMHIAAATSFAMNGTLYPGIVGHYNPATHQETVVAIEGNAQPNFKPMGKNVALELVNLAHFTTIPVNRNVAHSQLPNIGDITLHLSNANGSLTVALAASDTNKYRFTVSGDTGQFTTATGTGTAVLTLAPRHYVLTFTQDKH